MPTRPLRRAVLVLAALGVLLPARELRAGKKEDLLQADVDEIQRQVYDLKRMVEKQSEDMARILELLDGSAEARKERAQFNANIEALRGDLRSLSGRFDDTAARLTEVERKVTACARASLVPAAAEASAPAEPGLESAAPDAAEGADPAARFKQAHSDYVRDNLDLAIDEFRAFVRAHPEHENAPSAHYFIAMSYLKQHRNDEAVRELDELLARYPRAANAPDAMFRKGEALLQLNRMGQAVLVFNDVVSRYPGSPAATQASERLRELAAEPR